MQVSFLSTGTGQSCNKPLRIALAIDSSQSVFKQEFSDQRMLIDSVVSNFRHPAKAADFAVVLYNTQVRISITFDQFVGFRDLTDAIKSLVIMDPISSGSDLAQLFNTTFTKTPEVFLMLKKETKVAAYSPGFKVPDGRLGGVKKIAVTFGESSNIRDISNFHAVLQYADTIRFFDYPVINKITETLCYCKFAGYLRLQLITLIQLY